MPNTHHHGQASGRRDARVCMRAAAVIGVVAATTACTREPEDRICPELGPGDLVVTELRGPQSSPNSLPQWIELANVSGQDIDLEGLHLELQRLDGSGPLDMIVRYKRPVMADQYYVLGFIPDTMLEGGVDYGLGGEFDGDMYGDGLLSVVACGETVDEVLYRDLPTAGTRSLGIVPPTADGNDDDAAWCVDATAPEGPMTELGIPGTPGEANRPCE